MQTDNHEQREDPLPPRTLEFRQAMKDFSTMFPTLDADLIECVLRSNNGHVDSTIDQLLQLSQESVRDVFALRRGHRFNAYDDSTDSDDSIPSELLDPPTSSDDDDIPVREPPPMYTPRAGDSPSSFFGSGVPVEVPISEKKKGYKDKHHSSTHNSKMSKKVYRAWNPPMLGTLPEDFLRILPQQFMDVPASRDKSKNSLSSKKRTSPGQLAGSNIQRQPLNNSQISTARVHAQSDFVLTPMNTAASMPKVPTNDNHLQAQIPERNPGPVPPPRPSRTIDSHRSRRINGNDRLVPNHNDNIEQGNLFIQPAVYNVGNNTFQPVPPFEPSLNSSASAHRSRHHHHRSSRSHTSRPSTQQHQFHPLHPSTNASLNGSSLTRRHSDFSSHRMVMVSNRASEPNMMHQTNEMNGFHSPLPGDRVPPRHRSSRSSHHRHGPSNQSVPYFSRQQSDNTLVTNVQSSGRNQSASVSSGRRRQRTPYEEEQYVEDCRLAILLQNEEFISELKRNEEFLKALEKDRNKGGEAEKPAEVTLSQQNSPKEDSIVPLPDPDAKYPHGARNASSLKRAGMEDPEKEDESAFKENLKHMGKSARKKFNEIARKFSIKKKSSYKSMRNIDPVFANCDDDFDEIHRPQSPVFEL